MVGILYSQLDQVFEGASKALNPEARRMLKVELAARAALSQEAKRQGLDKSPAFQTQLRLVQQKMLVDALLADLAAMRSVAHRMGKNPKVVEPLVPVDLVVDHSVQIDNYGTPNALDLNMKIEFQRNQERYQFMKWGMQAFDTFKVVPPGIGIVHQVNLEYLARGVHEKAAVELALEQLVRDGLAEQLGSRRYRLPRAALKS